MLTPTREEAEASPRDHRLRSCVVDSAHTEVRLLVQNFQRHLPKNSSRDRISALPDKRVLDRTQPCKPVLCTFEEERLPRNIRGRRCCRSCVCRLRNPTIEYDLDKTEIRVV